VLEQTQIVWVVQVNGKVRGHLTLPAEATQTQVKAAVFADARIQRWVDNQPIKQVIIVPRRLVNLVL
jgi:leucyl-tRNA synthetase